MGRLLLIVLISGIGSLMFTWYMLSPRTMKAYYETLGQSPSPSPPWTGAGFHLIVSNRTVTNTDYEYCYRENDSTIIFIELTYSKSSWHPLEMCAFRTAALMNPNAGVCVLAARSMDEHPLLVDLPNLEIAPLDVALLFNGTPLDEWYMNYLVHQQSPGSYAMWELSDALRYAYLFKFGGKYMDTDTLTLRYLGDLHNLAAWESTRAIANGLLFFRKAHPLIEAAVNNFVKYFDRTSWGSVGPSMITALHKTGKYGPYDLLDYTAFFPVRWQESAIAFRPGAKDEVNRLINGSYTVHLSHFATSKFWDSEEGLRSDSFVGDFVHTFCS